MNIIMSAVGLLLAQHYLQQWHHDIMMAVVSVGHWHVEPEGKTFRSMQHAAVLLVCFGGGRAFGG
jgi:hypothetical protein